jgi:hypothetical protein
MLQALSPLVRPDKRSLQQCVPQAFSSPLERPDQRTLQQCVPQPFSLLERPDKRQCVPQAFSSPLQRPDKLHCDHACPRHSQARWSSRASVHCNNASPRHSHARWSARTSVHCNNACPRHSQARWYFAGIPPEGPVSFRRHSYAFLGSCAHLTARTLHPRSHYNIPRGPMLRDPKEVYSFLAMHTSRCGRTGLFPIPRYRWVLTTIQLRATRPLSLIVRNLHPDVENGPGPTTGALQLSLQHVDQQRIATNRGANFGR